MRCPSCLSYIPEGLDEPARCPQCGKAAASQAEPPAPDLPPAQVDSAPAPTPGEAPPELPMHTAFAPFFTLRAKLAFAPAGPPSALRALPSEGSISFGPEGFGVVFDDGRHWEKLLYRDITGTRIVDDSVVITSKDFENRLTFFHAWLPEVLSSPRKRRAYIFLELLGRVKSGLTPFEIASYQRRLV